jgi:hypothetical protein
MAATLTLPGLNVSRESASASKSLIGIHFPETSAQNVRSVSEARLRRKSLGFIRTIVDRAMRGS